MTPLRSPVLFLVFNRPDTTERVFTAIKKARPPRLYVAADGPRASRAGEPDMCARVRTLATAVDWPCEVRTLFREQNLGCKLAVSSALSWFFEQEEEGIILEDDILPHPAFFPYCDDLLERYRDESRVGTIAGSAFQNVLDSHYDYSFSLLSKIWGWASWRRVWRKYDVALSHWQEIKRQGRELDVFRTPEILAYFRTSMDGVANGTIDTWDYQLVYLLLSQSQFCIAPCTNLVENLGFGPAATHTTVGESPLPATRAPKFPLRSPETFEPDMSADQRYVTRHRKSFLRRFLGRALSS